MLWSQWRLPPKNSCLGTFDPPNCPLCRKPFLSVRIKRLHVDRLDPDEAKQTDYLNRLILAWGEISDEELVLLLEPIQNWLERKDSDKVRFLPPRGLFAQTSSAAFLLNANHVVQCPEEGCYHTVQVSAT